MRLCGAAVGWLSVAMQQSGGQIDYAVWSPDSQKSSLIHWNANVTDASSDNILNGAVNTKHLLSEYVQPRSDLNGNISVAGSRLFHRNVLNLFRPSRMDISWGGGSAFFFFFHWKLFQVTDLRILMMLLFLFSLTCNFQSKLARFPPYKFQKAIEETAKWPDYYDSYYFSFFFHFWVEVLAYDIHHAGLLCVRQQPLRSHCLYCSFSVVPADGERKRLYGVNGRACRQHSGSWLQGLSASAATARHLAAACRPENVWLSNSSGEPGR